ncbi:hypothetical protein CCP3SC1AL1_50005 [Gammaproteobacteria bacterium]
MYGRQRLGVGGEVTSEMPASANREPILRAWKEYHGWRLTAHSDRTPIIQKSGV